MKIKLLFLIVAFAPFVISADNQTMEISGKIYFTHQKPIFIYLVDEESSKKSFSGLFSIIILPNQKDTVQGFITYQFDKISRGTYGIRCFQDMNNNQKLDKGLFGPKEPWGLSWNDNKTSNWPSFSNFSFEAVDKKNTIDIILRD